MKTVARKRLHRVLWGRIANLPSVASHVHSLVLTDIASGWTEAASRLFVNFFQPSFKLAEKQRDGAKVTKRYHPPRTPCERLLHDESTPTAVRNKLSEIAAELDPLKLLEEMRAVQAYLAALADGEKPPAATSEPPNLAAFAASLSRAWHAGEVRPTFSIEAKPSYLQSLQKVSTRAPNASPTAAIEPASPSAVAVTPAITPEKPKPVYAEPGQAHIQALRAAWPMACRRLEEFPNINAMQLFEELCTQFPGRFTVQNVRSQSQSLAPSGTRARRFHRLEDVSKDQ